MKSVDKICQTTLKNVSCAHDSAQLLKRPLGHNHHEPTPDECPFKTKHKPKHGWIFAYEAHIYLICVRI